MPLPSIEEIVFFRFWTSHWLIFLLSLFHDVFLLLPRNPNSLSDIAPMGSLPRSSEAVPGATVDLDLD